MYGAANAAKTINNVNNTVPIVVHFRFALSLLSQWDIKTIYGGSIIAYGSNALPRNNAYLDDPAM